MPCLRAEEKETQGEVSVYLVHDKRGKGFHVSILHWSAVRDAIEETIHYLEPDFHGLYWAQAKL